MATSTWLITGSSRGLGLEIVRQLIRSPANLVIATCRNPAAATALQALRGDSKGPLHVVPLDVSDPDSIRSSVKTVEDILGDQGLDYLYNNAGISPGIEPAFDFEYSDLLETLKINIAAPALISQVYLPLVEKSNRKVIINVSSGLGSIGLDRGSVYSAYSVTKAGLNMLTYKQAKAKPDLIVITLAPGWTKTGEYMGGPNAVLEPYQSVEGQLKVVTGLTPQDSGKFFDYTGEILPW
ncbi:hypothetical protein POSPLADRAFT_1047550 [Postia placenta MAD-698-R-SB12]|uniref:NAD(P)-binding protein n=1 Tax=Postia placenta MAD-698-R-SB12 TaxID=670580 RepID=A0A1X6MY94_9APHY|nr:hypothetical protein POSPLADRAFT_1047550 [Postia placenta MAD-698-R-SB12]OSX61335.1 hypothetical protein POSPLADRAFT_1047550 [Postia placenta MAD-698-R-SB12]